MYVYILLCLLGHSTESKHEEEREENCCMRLITHVRTFLQSRCGKLQNGFFRP